MSNRWVELYATSPSGKTLFVCRFCGRISPTPDKACATPPTVVAYKLTLPCELLEEIEACVRESAEAVPDKDRQNKSGITITLDSPMNATVHWQNSRRVDKRTSVSIKSPKLLALIDRMQPGNEELSELERKHL
jgi:hypothetical protein